MSLPSNKTKHKLNNIEIVTDYITAINKEAKNYKNSRQKGNRDTNNSKSNSYIHALSMETNKSKEVTSSKLEKNNHEVKKMKRKRKKGRKNVVIQNKANDMKSGRLENNTMTTASSEINKSEAKQTEKAKEPLENIGFVKDNFRKRKQHKQLHTNGFLGASKLDRNNHRVNKDAEHRFNSSSKFTEPKRKHHRRESSDDANRMEISEQNDISRYKNGQIGRRVMRVENPIDVAKDIAGFGVNDYRYGESWFEGQNKPIARKRYHGNKEQPTTIDEDGNKASRGSAKNFHGFEQEEEGSSHVRDQPSQIKATGDEIQKAGQFVEDEQINSLVEQKTSNIMKKICHNAVCRNKDGSSDVDGGDDDLSNYVHGGDEIIAKVSIGGEGKGLPKQDIQRISKELAKISRQPIHVIGGLKLLHGIPKNVSATPEELREITGDERDMKNKCACDVSFASVMKIPGCMEYCKTTLQENSVYAKATHVITQMENNGHPLLYDRTSGDLIPHNPLLEAKTGLPSGKSLLPSNKMVGKLQLDKKVLEHVKNDIKHDPGISDVLKEHLKKVADSITKAKIEKILEAPVGKAFGRNFHQNYNDTDESDRSEGFSLQGGEEDSSDMTPIHIRADAAPELIAKLLHQTPHHHPHHHHHNRHFHHHHGDADELEGIDGDALNGIMHHSSSVEDEHDEHDSPKLQELTEPNVIHRLLHHHGIVDDDDGTSDENEQNEVEDGDDEKAVISKGTLLKLLHQSNDETDYDHSSRHHHHGNSLVTEEDDDDENDEKEEFVEDSDPDEHMMFHDKEDDDEKHGRHTHHHVMYPEPIHFKLHHDIVHQNVSAFRQSPCKNGGIYIPHHHRKAECVCPHQYYGKNCKDWNFCYPNPCHNGGQCMLISEIPYHKCICPKAYIGDTCKDFNPCDPSPCNNQGSCSHDGKVATCTCNPRFKGENCAELNNCFPNPCKNSGACVDSNGRFKCLCKEGYIGSTCEGVSYCYSNKPCENGGSCLENGTSYSCLCHKGFVGPTCKDKICSPNPCQNGGTCMQKENSAFACLCPPWATGDTCSDISPCRMNPCKNGARCIDAMSGFRWTLKPMQYFCDCLPPFQGAHCEKNPCSDCGHNAHCDIDHCVCNSGYYGNGLVCRKIAEQQNSSSAHSCHPNPCKNDGVCLEKKNGGFVCRCKLSFLPPKCEESDPCEPNPCGSFGECYARKDSIKCECRKQYRGQYCNVLDACKEDNLCKHGGQCLSTGNNTFTCSCLGKWSGVRCQDCSCAQSTADDIPSSHCNQAGMCVCPAGYELDNETGRCTKKSSVANSCKTNPCENGGQCIEDVNKNADVSTYRCVCPKGTFGKICARRHACYMNPCLNGGKCLELNGEFLGCKCPDGHNAPFCQKEDIPVFACAPSPCQNGATCMPHQNGGYDCICKSRFTGPHCTIDRCRDCDENAKCRQGRCICRAGYIGNGYECLKKPCPRQCLQFETCLDNHCVCIPGHQMVSGICQPITDFVSPSQHPKMQQSYHPTLTSKFYVVQPSSKPHSVLSNPTPTSKNSDQYLEALRNQSMAFIVKDSLKMNNTNTLANKTKLYQANETTKSENKTTHINSTYLTGKPSDKPSDKIEILKNSTAAINESQSQQSVAMHYGSSNGTISNATILSNQSVISTPNQSLIGTLPSNQSDIENKTIESIGNLLKDKLNSSNNGNNTKHKESPFENGILNRTSNTIEFHVHPVIHPQHTMYENDFSGDGILKTTDDTALLKLTELEKVLKIQSEKMKTTKESEARESEKNIISHGKGMISNENVEAHLPLTSNTNEQQQVSPNNEPSTTNVVEVYNSPDDLPRDTESAGESNDTKTSSTEDGYDLTETERNTDNAENILAAEEPNEKKLMNGIGAGLISVSSPEEKEAISDGLISKPGEFQPDRITSKFHSKQKKRIRKKKPDKHFDAKVRILSSYIRSHKNAKLNKVLDALLMKKKIAVKNKNAKRRRQPKDKLEAHLPLVVHVKEGFDGLKEISGIMKKFSKQNGFKIYSQEEMEKLLSEHQMKSEKDLNKKQLSVMEPSALTVKIKMTPDNNRVEQVTGVLKHSISERKHQAVLHDDIESFSQTPVTKGGELTHGFNKNHVEGGKAFFFQNLNRPGNNKNIRTLMDGFPKHVGLMKRKDFHAKADHEREEHLNNRDKPTKLDEGNFLRNEQVKRQKKKVSSFDGIHNVMQDLKFNMDVRSKPLKGRHFVQTDNFLLNVPKRFRQIFNNKSIQTRHMSNNVFQFTQPRFQNKNGVIVLERLKAEEYERLQNEEKLYKAKILRNEIQQLKIKRKQKENLLEHLDQL